MQCVVCDAEAANFLDGWERLAPEFSDSRGTPLPAMQRRCRRPGSGNPRRTLPRRAMAALRL